MQSAHTVKAIRSILDQQRRQGSTIGLVPTMGYLHEGHLSLVRRARAENAVTVVSIFVNPNQFAAGEDFTRYPRDEARDLALLDAEQADVVFLPSVEEMYPVPAQTTIDVGEIATRLEGARRPHHFSGVATVVTKLLAIVGPDRVYFGQKDAQQVAVIRQLIRELHMPVTLCTLPVVREPDGLAMSSRNVYLSPEERAAATVLSRALRAGQETYRRGERERAAIEASMAHVVAAGPLVTLDYARLVDPRRLLPLEWASPDGLLVLAATVGRTRLLDAGPVGGDDTGPV